MGGCGWSKSRTPSPEEYGVERKRRSSGPLPGFGELEREHAALVKEA